MMNSGIPGLRLLGLVCVVGLAAGCELPWAIECTTDARAAIQVEVVDSLSGASVLDPLVWVRDGEFRDTLEVFDGVAAGARERRGTYDVHVEHVDYLPWLQTGVRVTEDDCGHPRTRELTARLQPSG